VRRRFTNVAAALGQPLQQADGLLEGNDDVTFGFDDSAGSTDLADTRNKIEGSDGNVIALRKGFFKNKRSVNGAKAILGQDIAAYGVSKRAGRENGFGTPNSPGKILIINFFNFD